MRHFAVAGVMYVCIHGASNVKAADKTGASDPYCVLFCNRRRVRGVGGCLVIFFVSVCARVHARLPACLPACLSVSVYVYVSVSVCVCVCMRAPVCLSFCLSVCVCVSVFVCVWVYPCTFLLEI